MFCMLAAWDGVVTFYSAGRQRHGLDGNRYHTGQLRARRDAECQLWDFQFDDLMLLFITVYTVIRRVCLHDALHHI